MLGWAYLWIMGVSGLLAVIAWAILTPLELVLPRERHSLISRLRGATYAIIQIAFAGAVAVTFALGWRALHLPPLLKGANPALSIPASLLIGDFLYYWCHRAQHRWFWRLHAVHHSIRELNAINSYHHITEELVRLPLIALPMAVIFGAGRLPEFTALGIVSALAGFFIHSPTRFHLGWLRYVIGDNRYHRIHHSLEPRHFGKNFAAFFPIWDVVFGTAYFPERDEWPATGLADQAEPATLGAYLLAKR
jgi:sterol desaturase/sphingolipid hydroxylase (fatty acid hydroxylase superfamily)